jgi:hypothetical protein
MGEARQMSKARSDSEPGAKYSGVAAGCTVQAFSKGIRYSKRGQGLGGLDILVGQHCGKVRQAVIGGGSGYGGGISTVLLTGQAGLGGTPPVSLVKLIWGWRERVLVVGGGCSPMHRGASISCQKDSSISCWLCPPASSPSTSARPHCPRWYPEGQGKPSSHGRGSL